MDAKNSGIVIIWPMPISRSRLSTIPAIVIDRHEKNAAPSMTIANAPSMFSGSVVSATPRIVDSTSTTTTCAIDRMPAENDFPRISADRGVGVTRDQLALLEPLQIYAEPAAEGAHTTGVH